MQDASSCHISSVLRIRLAAIRLYQNTRVTQQHTLWLRRPFRSSRAPAWKRAVTHTQTLRQCEDPSHYKAALRQSNAQKYAGHRVKYRSCLMACRQSCRCALFALACSCHARKTAACLARARRLTAACKLCRSASLSADISWQNSRHAWRAAIILFLQSRMTSSCTASCMGQHMSFSRPCRQVEPYGEDGACWPPKRYSGRTACWHRLCRATTVPSLPSLALHPRA